MSGVHQVGKYQNRCEDAYFITQKGFGVSDGVSGWNKYGFSSSNFSNELMANAKNIIEKTFYDFKKH